MPRSNRRRPEPSDGDSLDRMIAGFKRTEVKHGTEWTVQPMSAAQALNVYTCPGCGRSIESGTAHVVAWRADGIMGEAADLAARRHWHSHCWKVY